MKKKKVSPVLVSSPSYGPARGYEISINTLAQMVSDHEGNKNEVNIADIKEVLKVVNTITRGDFYRWLKRTYNEPKKED